MKHGSKENHPNWGEGSKSGSGGRAPVQPRYVVGIDPYTEVGTNPPTIMKVTDGICEMVTQYRKDAEFLKEMARIAVGIPKQ